MKELRERLSAKLKELRQILEKAKAEKRALTADEETQYAALKTEADSIKSQIATEERSAELLAETEANQAQLDAIAPATQAGQRSDAQDTEARARVEVLTPKYERGDALGSIVTARFRFGTDRDAAVKWAERQYGSGSHQVRALQQSIFTSGGATIGGNFVASELIEFLRASAQVRKAGARELPLINGSATIPKVTGGATAYWGANEGDNITPSEETTGDVQMTEKKLTCLVPVSNDLLKNSTLQVDRLIRDDITRAAANAEDIAFLKGDGTKGSPRGIYYWVGATGRGNSAGTSLANSRTDIAAALNRLGNANAPMVKRAWFGHSRSWNYAGWQLVDANGNFAYPSLQTPSGGVLAGAPVYPDNNISIVLGGGTASEIYYAEMTECFIGDNGTLEIELFANATYADAAGTLRSGVSRDESVIRLIRKCDFAMRHAESAYVLENVLWI
jgi:HK97 family phage major capsid protein